MLGAVPAVTEAGDEWTAFNEPTLRVRGGDESNPQTTKDVFIDLMPLLGRQEKERRIFLGSRTTRLTSVLA